MVVDYSETINNAYPLPKIDEMVNMVVKYKYYSTNALPSASSIPLSEKDDDE